MGCFFTYETPNLRNARRKDTPKRVKNNKNKKKTSNAHNCRKSTQVELENHEVINIRNEQPEYIREESDGFIFT